MDVGHVSHMLSFYVPLFYYLVLKMMVINHATIVSKFVLFYHVMCAA